MTDELAELFRRIDASLAEALAQPPKPVLDDPSALADALDRGLAPHGLCVDRRRGLELTGDTVQVPLRLRA